MYDLERFYGTKVSFYKGTDSYKSYKLVQTPNFSVRLMPYSEFTKNMIETSNSCFQIHSKAAGYANYKSQMVTLNPLSHI